MKVIRDAVNLPSQDHFAILRSDYHNVSDGWGGFRTETYLEYLIFDDMKELTNWIKDHPLEKFRVVSVTPKTVIQEIKINDS